MELRAFLARGLFAFLFVCAGGLLVPVRESLVCKCDAFLDVVQDVLLGLLPALREHVVVPADVAFRLLEAEAFSVRRREVRFLPVFGGLPRKDAFLHEEVRYVGIEQVVHVHVAREQLVDVAHHAGNGYGIVEEAVARKHLGVDCERDHLRLGGLLLGLFGFCGFADLRSCRGLGAVLPGNVAVVQLLLQKRCHVSEALADPFLFAGVPFGQKLAGQRVHSARKFSKVSLGSLDNRIFRWHQ